MSFLESEPWECIMLQAPTLDSWPTRVWVTENFDRVWECVVHSVAIGDE